MKGLNQLVIIIALLLTVLAVIDVARTAILIRYDGLLDVKVSPDGGQITVVGGRSSSSELPPADKSKPD